MGFFDEISADMAYVRHDTLESLLDTIELYLDTLDFSSLSVSQYNAILNSVRATSAVMGNILITNYLRKDEEK